MTEIRKWKKELKLLQKLNDFHWKHYEDTFEKVVNRIHTLKVWIKEEKED